MPKYFKYVLLFYVEKILIKNQFKNLDHILPFI